MRAQPSVTFMMAYRFIQSFLHLNIKNKMIRGLALYCLRTRTDRRGSGLRFGEQEDGYDETV